MNLSRVGFAEGWLRRGLASPGVATLSRGLGAGKRGLIGEGIMMMYRMMVVSFVALVILGISSVFYVHYIDVRDAEAVVLTKVVVDCISPSGVLDLDGFSGDERLRVLSYCGFSDDEVERFYVGIEVFDGDEKIGGLSQGDSGAMWVKEIFDKGKVAAGIKKYEPGYFEWGYPVFVLSGGERVEGIVKMEVLINSD